MTPALILGGYGTFGAHVARALAQREISLIIAGRSEDRAAAFARSLGPTHRGRALDLTDARTWPNVLRDGPVVVNCAGSLASTPAFLDSCLTYGCHYADIVVERDHTRLVRGYGLRFRERGRAAVFGCSSLPAISGALAVVAARQESSIPTAVRVTLFIGNDNPKGAAAMGTFLAGLARPIEAPQGRLHGFRDRTVVALPAPFGPRGVFNFDGPEYDLFPELLGVRTVWVKVGFELRLVTYGCVMLAALGFPFRSALTTALTRLSAWVPRVGSSGGVVMTELFYEGSSRRAWMLARRDGQRMAGLPCAYVAEALCQGEPTSCGAQTAYEFLGADRLLQMLTTEGFEFTMS
jgi:hypothetical protein